MKKKQDRKEELTRSKYFSIDSYFKSPPKKKVKTEVENEITGLKVKKEQCPSCSSFIHVESESMEVHVNRCLDLQQLKESSVSVTWKDKFSFGSIKKETVVLVEEKKSEIVSNEEKENDIELKDKEEKKLVPKEENCIEPKEENCIEPKEENSNRVLPSSWKSLFSSVSTNTTDTKSIIKPVEIKSNIDRGKKKMCPFYKRVRGKIFILE